jgi:hypothetical protein
MPSIFPKPKPSRACCDGSAAGADAAAGFNVGFGAPGKNERPHWRHIVVFAAA